MTTNMNKPSQQNKVPEFNIFELPLYFLLDPWTTLIHIVTNCEQYRMGCIAWKTWGSLFLHFDTSPEQDTSPELLRGGVKVIKQATSRFSSTFSFARALAELWAVINRKSCHASSHLSWLRSVLKGPLEVSKCEETCLSWPYKNIGYRLKVQPIYRYSNLPITDNRYFISPSFYRYR